MVSVPDFYILIFKIMKSGGCGFESHQELSLVLLVGTPPSLFCDSHNLISYINSISQRLSKFGPFFDRFSVDL